MVQKNDEGIRSSVSTPDAVVSARRLAANRRNAERSTGPRTARGKAQARRNALRHGLATISLRNPSVSQQIELMAKSICGEGASRLLYQQALIIAESEVLLLNVRAARVGAVERMRIVEPTPKGQIPGFPSGQEMARGFEALARGKPRVLTRLCYRAARAFLAEKARIAAANARKAEGTGKVEGAGGQQSALMPQRDMGAAQEPKDESQPVVRDEVDAFCRALPELNRLDRYECRALSRRKRAIRKFDALKSEILVQSAHGTQIEYERD